MKHPVAVLIASVLYAFAAAGDPSVAEAPSPEYPFGNRIVMAQTPETGKKWHGGVRMKDLLAWDAYWNAGGWLTVDFMFAGVSGASLRNAETGDRINVTDNMKLFTVKSRPLIVPLKKYPYKIAAGITVYSMSFEFFNPETDEGFPSSASRQGALFITQSWFPGNRHYMNLLTAVTSRKATESRGKTSSFYIVPGYRGFLGNALRWSFDIEYYYMNPFELPFKTLQLAFDFDQNEFSNPDRRFVSFMFWGFSYTRSHVRVEVHLGNHISFAGPKIPMLGIGWNF